MKRLCDPPRAPSIIARADWDAGTFGVWRASMMAMDRIRNHLIISAGAFALCLYILCAPLLLYLYLTLTEPDALMLHLEREERRWEALDRRLGPITEIYLARFCESNMPSPNYSVTLRKDGTVIYVGNENVARLGTHRGKISGYYFFRLAWLLDEQRFFQMKDEYIKDPNIVSSHWCEATVGATRDGRKKEVWEYDGEGPIALWGIQQAIDSVLPEIEWEPKK
jgi:Domain of unknown function (DUF6438)